jgi:hypothetical protein
MRKKIDVNVGAEFFRWLSVLLCIIGAAWVGASGHDGWGWFLFIAVILAL